MTDRWTFLDTFNTTGFKGWSVGWLWVYTGGVWGIVALVAVVLGKDTPTEWLFAWMGGLCGYSGVSAYQFTKQRETDWELNRIKAGTPTGKSDG